MTDELELERARQEAAKAARIDYRAVARVWRRALRERRPPTRSVADAFGIPYATAAQRVHRARLLGMLERANGTGVRWAARCPTCGAYMTDRKRAE